MVSFLEGLDPVSMLLDQTLTILSYTAFGLFLLFLFVGGTIAQNDAVGLWPNTRSPEVQASSHKVPSISQVAEILNVLDSVYPSEQPNRPVYSNTSLRSSKKKSNVRVNNKLLQTFFK